MPVRRRRPAKVVRPRETEKDFMRAVVGLAEAYGYKVYHPWTSIKSAPGFPDLTCVRPATRGRPGRLCFIEVKVEHGKLTPHQALWLALLNDSVPGVHALCVRPSDWDQLVEWLK